MSRRIEKGYLEGLEQIQIIPEEGSSLGVREIDKQLVFCKYNGCPHPGRNITEDNAMMASCCPYTYFVHTNCYPGIDGNKCPVCKKPAPAPFVSVRLNPVQMATEKKQSIWRKLFPRKS